MQHSVGAEMETCGDQEHSAASLGRSPGNLEIGGGYNWQGY